MGPIDFPFHSTSMPPALPTFMVATSEPNSVLVWLGSRTPEKMRLPSQVMESQVFSVAERFTTTRLTPSGPVVVVTLMAGVFAAAADPVDAFTGTSPAGPLALETAWSAECCGVLFHHA